MAKHFLHISDYSKEELLDILHLAKELKIKFRNREDYTPFKNCSLAMIFAKPSARTRVSFETGFEWMGGSALFLGPNDIGIGKREAIKDISRLFSRYNDMIMARLFDHKHILGKDILSITKEKSGIIKKNIPVVLSHQDLKAEQYIIKVANKMNSPINKIADINNIHLSPLGTEFKYKSETFITPLLGFHQAQNAATSIEIAKTFNNKIKTLTIQKGLTNTKWHGRMQKVSSSLPIYYDVAHNDKGVEAMIDTIRSIYKTLPHIVLSLKGDKEIELISKALMNNFESLIITGSDKFDLLEANDLYKFFTNKSNQENIEKVKSIDKSFDLLINKVETSHNPGIIMGSHYMAKSVFDKFGIFR